VFNRVGVGRKQQQQQPENNSSFREQLRQIRQESEEYKDIIQLLTTQLHELQMRKSKKNIPINFE